MVRISSRGPQVSTFLCGEAGEVQLGWPLVALLSAIISSYLSLHFTPQIAFVAQYVISSCHFYNKL